MGKYTVIAAFNDLEEGRLRDVGETLDVDDERGAVLVAKRVAKEVKLSSNNDIQLPPEVVHVGGGYYQLPNGEKVKGKEQALEALAALQSENAGTGGNNADGRGAEGDPNSENTNPDAN